MNRHFDRLKSIRTPALQRTLAPSKRKARQDDGPNPFQLQRQAEQIGAGTYCDVGDRKIGITKAIEGDANKHNFSRQLIADAAFAASCAIARLRYENRITQPQYRAGLEYARLFYLTAGKTTPKQSALAKAIASSLEERLAKEAHARREERDDDEYDAWIADMRVEYRRALYRLAHLRGLDIVERRIVRTDLNRTVVESIMPVNARWLGRVRLALQELADMWGIEEEK